MPRKFKATEKELIDRAFQNAKEFEKCEYRFNRFKENFNTDLSKKALQKLSYARNKKLPLKEIKMRGLVHYYLFLLERVLRQRIRYPDYALIAEVFRKAMRRNKVNEVEFAAILDMIFEDARKKKIRNLDIIKNKNLLEGAILKYKKGR